jgi:hypothetical protein
VPKGSPLLSAESKGRQGKIEEVAEKPEQLIEEEEEVE